MLPAGIVAQGLVFGALAALDAIAIVLVYRTTRVVNLAATAMGSVGGVLTGMLVSSAGWSFWWAAPVGIAVGAALGLGTERIVLRRLRDVPRAVLLVATIGIAQVFGGIAVAIPFAFGGALPTYPIDLGFTVDVFPVRLLGPHLLTLMLLPVVAVGAHVFLNRSRFGLAASALGQDAERARALGVPAAVVRAVVWSVAGAISTVSGILLIPVRGFNLGGGLSPLVLLLALVPAVLAGLRSLTGAVVAALALGVGYELAVFHTDTASAADLTLAAAVIVAIALRRRRLGREEAAARASSWEAAATPRPLHRRVASLPAVRAGAGALLAVALAGAALPPVFLSPSQDVGYATAASIALAALAVAVAWMFAGEVLLGLWGLAGFGAVLAAVTPGPWPLRSAVSAVALAATGAVLAYASRRGTRLSFAVVSLAAAAVAPVAVLRVVGRTVEASPALVGTVTGIVAVAVAVGVAALRRSIAGTRIVAARDDPARAAWLGADVVRSRVVALTIAAGIAGLAGAFYFAASPGGLRTGAEGSFDPIRSLELLTMAVVGGLGSPFGALAGAAAILAGQAVLPGSWETFVRGAGVLLVIIFAPSGMSGALTRARDAAVRVLAGRAGGPAAAEEAA